MYLTGVRDGACALVQAAELTPALTCPELLRRLFPETTPGHYVGDLLESRYKPLMCKQNRGCDIMAELHGSGCSLPPTFRFVAERVPGSMDNRA